MVHLIRYFFAVAIAVGASMSASGATQAAEPSTWRPWLDKQGLELRMPVPPILPAPQTVASNTAWLERWGRTTPVLSWNEIAVELIVKYQQNPLRAARALTLLHAAMHDALVLCAQAQCNAASNRIALHAAAGPVLKHLYPQESPGRFEALVHAATLATVATQSTAPDVASAWRNGSRAALAAITRALDDGADLPRNLAARPAPRPGLWRAAPPLNIYDPAEPRAPEWRTWVLHALDPVAPPPPVELGSSRYWAEVEEVRRIAANLTAAQKKIADDWNLDLGTITPAGVWNLRARRLIREGALDDAQATQVFAALNVAMADAFIAAWRAKLKWWTERPITAIRDKLDPTFTPHLITPAFPSYVSGHAAVSGAAATVLATFFPDQAAQLQRDAEEAALSRLYGGIHFASDNNEGLNLGRRVGERVVARLRSR